MAIVFDFSVNVDVRWDVDDGGAPIIDSFSPVANEMVWDYIQIAEFLLPPVGYGVAKVKAKSGQKIDEKKGSGTDKASLTQTGTKLTTAEVEITVNHQGWFPYCYRALKELDPNNPDRKGGPFDVWHFDLARRGCFSMLVEDIGEVEWQGAGVVKFTISLKEWVPPAPTPDATTTPKKSDGTDSAANAPIPKAAQPQNDSGLPNDPNTGAT